MKLLFLFVLTFSIPLFAQVEYSQGVVPPGESPGFFIDAANYKGETEGKTRIDIYFQIPYSNLQFVKYQNKFRAKYSFTLTIYDEDKDKIIIEKTWNGKIIANDFNEASSENNSQFGFKSLELEPNNYVLAGLLFDKDSKKEYSIEAQMEVREFLNSPQFSDILFIESEIDSQIVLNISNISTTADTSLHFYYEAYAQKLQEISIEYLIEDKDEQTIFQSIESVVIDSGITQIKKKLDNYSSTLGYHKLFVKLLNEDGKTRNGVSKLFLSKIAGFPISIIDLDLSIEQMEYIATGDEIDEIKDAESDEDKLEKFKAFWKKKDPAPTTAQNRVMREYYRRVAYANKHFKHYFDGWKTDMGMIYIVLGPPDNVDRHPFEYDSKPYEVWHFYNINQSFYFIDETGFGDYRLLNRNYGDWYRYRQ